MDEIAFRNIAPQMSMRKLIPFAESLGYFAYEKRNLDANNKLRRQI